MKEIIRYFVVALISAVGVTVISFICSVKGEPMTYPQVAILCGVFLIFLEKSVK